MCSVQNVMHVPVHSSLSKAWFQYGAASPRWIALGALRGTPAEMGSLRDRAGTFLSDLAGSRGRAQTFPVQSAKRLER